jgi:abequosyltransferase
VKSTSSQADGVAEGASRVSDSLPDSARASGASRAPLLSICIPAYNKVDEIGQLLASIAAQPFDDFEVVVSEDCSPRASEIEQAVRDFAARHPQLVVRYSQNERNLGYDGNFRALLSKARGEYCLYTGDDDLIAPGGLDALATALRRHPHVAAARCSWATFDSASLQATAYHRYFATDRYFPPGVGTVVTFFRRFVVIAGLVLHRESALKYNTDRYDGTLLYQLHVVANVLLDAPGLFVAQTISMARGDVKVHFFGSSEAERKHYTPGKLPPGHSLAFMRGMLDIARGVERDRGVQMAGAIARDVANYSFPVLSVQAERSSRMQFARYAIDVARMGLGRSPLFAVYFVMLVTLGPKLSQRAIELVRSRLGRTPVFGRIYQGEPV